MWIELKHASRGLCQLSYLLKIQQTLRTYNSFLHCSSIYYIACCLLCSCIEDITFEQAPSNQYLRRHAAGVIQCVVSGQPQPTISWTFRGSKITTGMYVHGFIQCLVRSFEAISDALVIVFVVSNQGHARVHEGNRAWRYISLLLFICSNLLQERSVVKTDWKRGFKFRPKTKIGPKMNFHFQRENEMKTKMAETPKNANVRRIAIGF